MKLIVIKVNVMKRIVMKSECDEMGCYKKSSDGCDEMDCNKMDMKVHEDFSHWWFILNKFLIINKFKTTRYSINCSDGSDEMDCNKK
ncbi:hypothetical protein KUTeg_000213 [Tegillarca granosa]|uniref:Uncharacterized protein n=1 Tax=Tegillarca granosa TaxID=220873 RepID=A0ABQ9FWW3_TEGGR|nr:hypothetical protein KUTeg_000213 [Tegillarca granosa]